MKGATSDEEIMRLANSAQQRFDLKGKRVLISGAANGLGRTMAFAFAAAGAHVAALGREQQRLDTLTQVPGITFTGCGDVTDPAIEAVVRQAIAQLGGLDVLINNAGETPYSGIAAGSAESLSGAFEVNCGGSARLVRTSVEALRRSGCGRIINFASAAVAVAPKEIGAFVAAKAAVIGMTRALASELGSDNITANVIAPGLFPTRAVLVIPDQEASYAWMIGGQAAKRVGSLDDIACTAMFLASDAASFITGQTLLVDGGFRFL